ncbi:hypothetical protein [Providencia phage PSTCR5]|uniref:Uncharacterized protein n=1 Tax=Providencia phage PSTCR5 TaxID=2783547 RepID=A0A873WS45_9CAUD|nr:hypothetical protein KNV68_gp050 [Providencia phage PSTCR5]QPB12148.1 hypothetical protein [Providencia phage PSTCR5]
MRKSDDGKSIIFTESEAMWFFLLFPGIWFTLVLGGIAILLPFFI